MGPGSPHDAKAGWQHSSTDTRKIVVSGGYLVGKWYYALFRLGNQSPALPGLVRLQYQPNKTSLHLASLATMGLDAWYEPGYNVQTSEIVNQSRPYRVINCLFFCSDQVRRIHVLFVWLHASSVFGSLGAKRVTQRLRKTRMVGVYLGLGSLDVSNHLANDVASVQFVQIKWY